MPSKENYDFCFVFFLLSTPQTELDSRTDVAGPPSKTWLQEGLFSGSTGSCVGWISWLESTQGIILLKMSNFYQLTAAPPPAGGDVTQSLQPSKLGFALSPGSILLAVSWQCGRGTSLSIPKSPSVHAHLQIHTHTHIDVCRCVCIYIKYIYIFFCWQLR